jgi:hypothetical protein
MTLPWYAVAALLFGLLFFCVIGALAFYHCGFIAGLDANLARPAGLRCDYFLNPERCRLPLGHEGPHVPPVSKGDV